MSYQQEKFKEIADKIRKHTGDMGIKPSQFADKVDEVYTVGYSTGASEQYPIGYQNGLNDGKAIGYSEGHSAGIDEGKQAEYDEFWDNYQYNGNRTVCERMFSGYGWSDKTFKPKYSIQPINANAMFSYSNITDLKKLLDDAGATLDFSKVTYGRVTQMFMESKVTNVGVIDLTSCGSSITYFLYGASNLVNVDKVIIPSDGSMTINNTNFNSASALEEIRFEGVIGQDGFNMKWSKKLSKASITSIINCLSTTTSGLAVTLSLEAVNKAFETSVGANDGSTSAEWKTLESTRTNWTISLV